MFLDELDDVIHSIQIGRAKNSVMLFRSEQLTSE
jgi:hypothetical protein